MTTMKATERREGRDHARSARRKLFRSPALLPIVLALLAGSACYHEPTDPMRFSDRNLCEASERFVRSQLRAPSTASFQECDTRMRWQEGRTWHTSGYVDAQNGFGAKIRAHWESTMVREPGQFRDMGTYVE